MRHTDFSVIIPVYDEEENLPELIRRCLSVCRSIGGRFEILFIDDGSRDGSRGILRKASRENPEIRTLVLNRNYGQHAAILAGFEQSKGETVVTIDADLQNPPEEIPRLLREIDLGFDVVGTVRKNRKDSFFRRAASSCVNRIVRQATGVGMRDYGCMLRAYRRRVVDAMLQCKEHSTFIPVLANSFAEKTSEIAVEHDARENGASKYGFLKLLALQFDLLTSISTFPLRMLSLIGGAISVAGIGFGVLLALLRIIYGAAWAAEGIFTLFAVLFVFIGAQFIGLGLLGEYIGRIYHDVRERPRFLVKETYGDPEPGETFVAAPSEASKRRGTRNKKSVLVLGANGFIGSHLSRRLLEDGGYEVHALDRYFHSIEDLKKRRDFHFTPGDVSSMGEWIGSRVRHCDIVIPLAAIATPMEYVRNPLRVFELDFEENVRVVRHCAKYRKRLIFPSTSEVYGMCADAEFDERDSCFVQGPVHKQRWIYSCCKQMLDRVIWAYGIHEKLQFTLFRPFNWIGPGLDSLESARNGNSRAITRFIYDLVEGNPIRLVEGGHQRRCFTDVSDGIECLIRIIENKDGCCDGEILNIGNPHNEYSMKELAERLTKEFSRHPLRKGFPAPAGMESVSAGDFYGRGYQDMQNRRPSIERAQRLLGWNPAVPLEKSLISTLDYFLQDAMEKERVRHAS